MATHLPFCLWDGPSHIPGLLLLTLSALSQLGYQFHLRMFLKCCPPLWDAICGCLTHHSKHLLIKVIFYSLGNAQTFPSIVMAMLVIADALTTWDGLPSVPSTLDTVRRGNSTKQLGLPGNWSVWRCSALPTFLQLSIREQRIRPASI